MTALLRAWAARSGLICWLSGEHKETRLDMAIIDPADPDLRMYYNRECVRCRHRRLAKERKKATNGRTE